MYMVDTFSETEEREEKEKETQVKRIYIFYSFSACKQRMKIWRDRDMEEKDIDRKETDKLSICTIVSSSQEGRIDIWYLLGDKGEKRNWNKEEK